MRNDVSTLQSMLGHCAATELPQKDSKATRLTAAAAQKPRLLADICYCLAFFKLSRSYCRPT